MSNYISVTDTAKLIRKALAKHFPGIIFSVRSKSYSGGASIRVEWTDGPTAKMVEEITGKYQGATFDGMIDLKSYVTSTDENGREVHYGADYVFTDRNHSWQALQRAAFAVAQKYGGAVLDGLEIVERGEYPPYLKHSLEDFRKGREHEDLIYREMREYTNYGEHPVMTAVLGKNPKNLDWYAKALEQAAIEQKRDAEYMAKRQAEETPAASNVIALDEPKTFASGATSHARLEVFKGHPVIALCNASGLEMSFGLTKAKLILEQMDAIRNFVEAQDNA